MPLTIHLPPAEEQLRFNLKRWKELLDDSELAGLPYRIESDRFGQIIMSPPPAPAHGRRQNKIGSLLEQLLADGQVVTECPVSTSDGVKIVDVAWLKPGREAEVESAVCLARAPEVCVEILSPSNSNIQIEQTRALYFDAGADEVWICELDGAMRFYSRGKERPSDTSMLCPEFPNRIP